MGIINILPGEISNKIAAGEVVERPASVIKELVENSIDAGATIITVEIKKGGSTYMRVTDNGKGMTEDDAKICFLRHATSKIHTDEDLDEIYTLGFRGEALSSIGAVSKVTLYTKSASAKGICVKCEGGEILSSQEAGLPSGTSVIVENLFFNTPARAKFLKKDSTEAGYITDIVSRFIFAHPGISFRLIINGKEKFLSPGDSNIKNAICTVYGYDFAPNLIPVSFSNDGINVTGMIGTSRLARSNRSCESFFVNKRYIKSPRLMAALEEAFKNQLMTGKFPLAVLNIEINPLLIDINVHPTKLEVKFSDDKQIFHCIYYAVKNALYAIPDSDSENNMTSNPETQTFNPRRNPFILTQGAKHTQHSAPSNGDAYSMHPSYSKTTAPPSTLKEQFKNLFNTSSVQTISDSVPADVQTSYPSDNAVQQPNLINELAKTVSPDSDTSDFDIIDSSSILFQYKPQTDTAKNEECISDTDYFKIVGQAFDTYIIIEQGNTLMMIDQHAAHERLKYEELISELDSQGIYSQILIEPVIITLSSHEAAIFAEAEPEITGLGFDCSIQDNTLSIHSAPSDVDASEIEDLISELLDQFECGRHQLISDTRQRLLYTVACKSAVKANHKLSEPEMESLVKSILNLKNINTCPHGRPIIISKTKKEIEKSFKRIV